jgi:adenosine deaminase
VAYIEQHPLRQLFDAGVHVTLNTDDPTFFNTTLTGEYRLAARALGFNIDDLVRLALNGVRATFLPPDEQARMLREFEAEFARLRETLLTG